MGKQWPYAHHGRFTFGEKLLCAIQWESDWASEKSHHTPQITQITSTEEIRKEKINKKVPNNTEHSSHQEYLKTYTQWSSYGSDYTSQVQYYFET